MRKWPAYIDITNRYELNTYMHKMYTNKNHSAIISLGKRPFTRQSNSLRDGSLIKFRRWKIRITNMFTAQKILGITVSRSAQKRGSLILWSRSYIQICFYKLDADNRYYVVATPNIQFGVEILQLPPDLIFFSFFLNCLWVNVVESCAWNTRLERFFS